MLGQGIVARVSTVQTQAGESHFTGAANVLAVECTPSRTGHAHAVARVSLAVVASAGTCRLKALQRGGAADRGCRRAVIYLVDAGKTADSQRLRRHPNFISAGSPSRQGVIAGSSAIQGNRS